MTKALRNILKYGLILSVIMSCKKDELNVPPYVYVVDNIEVTEGDTDDKIATFRVKVIGALLEDGSKPQVKYTVSHVTTTDEDVVTSSGTLEFSEKGEVKEVNVTIKSDQIYEYNKEFKIRISKPINCRIVSSDDSKVGLLKDNDPCVEGDCDGYLTPDEYAGHTYDWGDEFDGDVLDNNLWGYDFGGGGWWNAQLQEFTSSPYNVRIDTSSGELVLRAIYFDDKYFSAQVKTQDNKLGKYINQGRLDIRAKFPAGKGVWPRIWLKPQVNEWPKTGEIIMAEIYGHIPNIAHTLVDYGEWGNYERHPFSVAADDHRSMEDIYHTYSLIWESDRLKFLVDGNQYAELTAQEVQDQGHTYPYTADFHLIFSMAVGGVKVGEPDPDIFPKEMRIDYVRFFRKN